MPRVYYIPGHGETDRTRCICDGAVAHQMALVGKAQREHNMDKIAVRVLMIADSLRLPGRRTADRICPECAATHADPDRRARDSEGWRFDHRASRAGRCAGASDLQSGRVLHDPAEIPWQHQRRGAGPGCDECQRPSRCGVHCELRRALCTAGRIPGRHSSMGPRMPLRRFRLAGMEQVYVEHVGVDIPGFNVPPVGASKASLQFHRMASRDSSKACGLR